MAVDIKVPQVGESISEGTIARWLKKDGEAVRANEPLFELETEKATSEVPAPAAGTLRITVREGQTVPIGGVVGSIEAGAPAPRAETPRENAPAAQVAPDRKAAAEKKTAPAPLNETTAKKEGEALLSPSPRQLATAESADVLQMKGSRRGGRITK